MCLLSFLPASGFLAGCVERVLQVRSDPPGATVYLNGDEIGKTSLTPPFTLSHPFTFYGTVEVALRAPGHLLHRELKTLSPPWYEVFPIDFFSELIVPWRITDLHEVRVAMEPAGGEESDALKEDLERKAGELRSALEPRS